MICCSDNIMLLVGRICANVVRNYLLHYFTQMIMKNITNFISCTLFFHSHNSSEWVNGFQENKKRNARRTCITRMNIFINFSLSTALKTRQYEPLTCTGTTAVKCHSGAISLFIFHIGDIINDAAVTWPCDVYTFEAGLLNAMLGLTVAVGQ